MDLKMDIFSDVSAIGQQFKISIFSCLKRGKILNLIEIRKNIHGKCSESCVKYINLELWFSDKRGILLCFSGISTTRHIAKETKHIANFKRLISKLFCIHFS